MGVLTVLLRASVLIASVSGIVLAARAMAPKDAVAPKELTHTTPARAQGPTGRHAA